MLTSEILKSNIPQISDADIAKIVELSTNDESAVIAKAVSENRGQFWKQIDEDIHPIFGEAKGSTEKTHEYLKRALNDLKTKAANAGDATALNTQISALNSEIETLKKSGGGDTLLKTEISTLEQRLTDKNNELSTLRENLEKERDDFKGKYETQSTGNLNLRTTNHITAAITNKKIQFKSTIGESLRARMYEMEMNDFLSNSKREVLSENGKETIIFRNEANEIMRNPDNKLNPYTADELFLKRAGVIELIDAGKAGAGGGTNTGGASTSTSTLDLGANATQVTALKNIRNHIIQNERIAKTDQNFAARQEELVKENNVLELPAI